ncbi:hypothetical protein ACFVMC_20660 [Nocardia sp. NPDC127579]|uniref:hypothetical protein n=1 Tax=Nocardia sp. NPDC127579 TaxID=3345402 RepID=UPI003643DFB3
MAHQTVENFYAPLVVPVGADRGEPFEIAGAVVMLSDPLALADSVANWAAAGVDPPPLSTVILESDDQFDALVASSFLAGMGVLVDPLFDRRGKLVSACVIENFAVLVATVE